MKKKIMKRLTACTLILVCSLTIPLPGFSQSEEETDSIQKEEVYEPGPLIKVKKESGTTAYSSAIGADLAKTLTANLSNTLFGRLPGLTVLQGSGEPGYDAASLRIRGIGSYNYGNMVVFVDGYQTDFSYFQYLSPNEIESVSILKDAAALSTFGMRGANGVLWVTTKRGGKSRPVVSLNVKAGLQQPTVLNKPLGAYDYARLYNEAYSNDLGTWSEYYSQQQVNDFKSGGGVNTDWFSQVLRKSSPITRTDVTVKGGGDAAKYFVLLGHMRNTGLYNLKNDETHSNATFQQFNVRANLDFLALKIFEGRMNIGGRTETRRFPNYNGPELWNNMARYPSLIYPAVNPDGTYPGTTVYPDNPLASVKELGYKSNHDRTLLVNFDLKERLDFIANGLYLNQGISFNTWTRGTYSVTKDYARILNGVNQTTHLDTEPLVRDDNGTNQWNRLQYKAGIGYQHEFDQSTLNTAVEYLQNQYLIDANINETGNNNKFGYQNISGRIHYDWQKRFMGELGFAYSGSDNYAKGNRFGFYPSLSLGWNIFSDELSVRNDYFNLLKLRVSAGTSAYDYFSGGRYLYQEYYRGQGGYATGDGAPVWHTGLGLDYIPNQEIFAEKSTKFNIGLDGKIFDRLSFSVDAFTDKRSGIITPDNSLTGVFGAQAPYRNIGKVTSTGFELAADYGSSEGVLKYNLGGNISYVRNIIDYMAEYNALTQNAAQTGKAIGTRFGYEAQGFYDVADFNSDGTLKSSLPVPNFGRIVPGDVKYRDINGDNKIDEYDMTQIGNGWFPKWNYAAYARLAYRGFDFEMLFHGIAGRDINLLDSRIQNVAFENNGNVFPIAENRWAYYPDQGIDTRASASYPRLSLLSNSNNYKTSSLWIKNADYLRLRNIELGYTLPANVTERFAMSRVRLSVGAVNPFTISSLTKEFNLDPEVLSGYPALRSYNAGLSITF